MDDARAADPAGWAVLEADLVAIVSRVAQRNPDLVDSDRLQQFLFGADRVSLDSLTASPYTGRGG